MGGRITAVLTLLLSLVGFGGIWAAFEQENGWWLLLLLPVSISTLLVAPHELCWRGT